MLSGTIESLYFFSVVFQLWEVSEALGNAWEGSFGQGFGFGFWGLGFRV